jgi:hypothetical protein
MMPPVLIVPLVGKPLLVTTLFCADLNTDPATACSSPVPPLLDIVLPATFTVAAFPMLATPKALFDTSELIKVISREQVVQAPKPPAPFAPCPKTAIP